MWPGCSISPSAVGAALQRRLFALLVASRISVLVPCVLNIAVIRRVTSDRLWLKFRCVGNSG